MTLTVITTDEFVARGSVVDVAVILILYSPLSLWLVVRIIKLDAGKLLYNVTKVGSYEPFSNDAPRV